MHLQVADELEGRMVPNQEVGRIELVSGFCMIASTGDAVLQMGMCDNVIPVAGDDIFNGVTGNIQLSQHNHEVI